MSLKLRRRRRTIAGTSGQSGGSGPVGVPTIWDQMLSVDVAMPQPKKKKRSKQGAAALALAAGLL